MAVAESDWKCYVLVFLVLFAMFGVDDIDATSPEVTGIRSESSEWTNVEEGLLVLTATVDIPVRLFGSGFTSSTSIRFSADNTTRGDTCTELSMSKPFSASDAISDSALFYVNLDIDYINDAFVTMCIKNENGQWLHLGDASWLRVKVVPKPVKQTILPVWLQSIIIGTMLCLSGLFSGLNLGLMSLDKTELRIVENCGSNNEKKYAKTIAPIRKRGNFLLCTILLGNVLVNNTLTILLDDLVGNGGAAIIGATLGIVVFGEIIPQAVCSRYGLAVGARTIWITKFFMILTFPISFPISLLLDCVLGEEIGNTYNRDRLRELLKVTQGDIDLMKDEYNIIAGALELSKKTVCDIMTKLEDVYMLEYNSILDFETMNDIMNTGYTRIPVYEKERTNIVALLNIKDLAFIDPDDKVALSVVSKFYNHPINTVYDDTRLDVMLEEFKKGRSHMSLVQRVNNMGDGDPFYEVLGVVTLEDVIEEIIQSEIVDETDVIIDNKQKVPRHERQHRDFSVFTKPSEENVTRLSPQLALATFQYLSTSVKPFRPDKISETVLQRLIKKDLICEYKMKNPGDEKSYIYSQGKVADYFVLILQGTANVQVGAESITFEAGPFNYFGAKSLTLDRNLSKNNSVTSIVSASDAVFSKPSKYIPDFTLQATTDLLYMKLRRAHYIAAYRATLMERHPRRDTVTEDQFAKEWNRVNKEEELSNNQIKVELEHDDSKDSNLTSPSLDGEVPRTRSETADSIESNVPDEGSPLVANCAPTSAHEEVA